MQGQDDGVTQTSVQGSENVLVLEYNGLLIVPSRLWLLLPC
jgi:hypothetical protein